MRYDQLFERLANRAIAAGGIDLDAFIEDALAQGMSIDAVLENLIDDLENGGPVFGKFSRSVFGASEQSVSEAHRQGQIVGQSLSELERFSRLTDDDIDRILDDPGALEEIELTAAPLIRLTWVAELVNTCHRCLPLHGTSLTSEEWKSRGLEPATIHSGWNSPCHCQLVEESIASDARGELMAPLTRVSVKSPTGLKGSRKTVRAVAQIDIDKALAARDAAVQSEQGRRTLRLAGMANEQKHAY